MPSKFGEIVVGLSIDQSSGLALSRGTRSPPSAQPAVLPSSDSTLTEGGTVESLSAPGPGASSATRTFVAAGRTMPVGSVSVASVYRGAADEPTAAAPGASRLAGLPAVEAAPAPETTSVVCMSNAPTMDR